MSYQDVIGRAAGERPSEAVGRFLEQYLLPGEPVLAAVRGTTRHLPVWVVVTPGIVVVVRDGVTVTVEGAATPSEGISWTAGGRWRHHVLQVDLGPDQVTVGEVAGRRLQPFLAAADDVMASLDRGFPPQVAGVLRGLDATATVATARPAPPDSTPHLLGGDVFRAIAGALTDPTELSFHLALVLVACSDLSGADDSAEPRPGRRETVVAALTRDHLTAVEDYAAVRSLRAAQSRGGDTAAWRGIVTALATAVAAAASLLAPDSPRARASLHDTAAALREVSRVAGDATPAAPARDAAGGDLLDTLERLHRLRESGALVEAEYVALKRNALGA